MDLVSLARNPVPSGAVSGMFKGYDGAPLRFARWAATRGPKRGTVCVFPGRNEFIEKYFEVVADLRRRGFAVAIMDWRGQGGSHRALPNPRKAHIRDFSEYDKDLAAFMREVVLPDCPPPYYALAHSMGGHILIRNSVMPGSWFERMVLSAPMIEINQQQLGMAPSTARLLLDIAVLTGFGTRYTFGGKDHYAEPARFEDNELTCDRERYNRYRAVIDAAPQLTVGAPTMSWLRAALRSSRMITDPEFARRVRVPMFLFVAGKDTIVSPRAIEDFAARLKVGSHVVLPNAKHEILQETDDVRRRFWAAFDAYMGLDAEPGVVYG
jgi:lysophospholipase